jgi:hypothetical protein
MASENFKIKDLEIYELKTDQKLRISDQFLTEQELLSQLEELRKKQKEMEDAKVEIEFNKQKTYLIDKLRKFLDMEVSDEEIISVYNDKNLQSSIKIFDYYLEVEDEEKKLLNIRKVFNRYARENEIRYEDSIEIIYEFIQSIKPLNDYGNWCRTHNRNTDEYVPLFCDLSEEENE